MATSGLRRIALFLHAAALLTAIGIGRGLAPRATMKRVADARSKAFRAGGQRPSLPEDVIIGTAERVARLVPHGKNCLVLSLSTQLLLARHGHDSTLTLGVDPLDPGGSAHAWLEREGVVLGGDSARLRRYVRVRSPEIDGYELTRPELRRREGSVDLPDVPP